MFTGIVTAMGRVADISPMSGGRRLAIEDAATGRGLGIGDSVAVNGVCLTVVACSPPRFEVEAIAETLSRTNLGDLDAGDPVNLERPMAADGRFDGHVVQGHVDGVAVVRSVSAEGDSRRVWMDLDADLLRYVAVKGSVAVDGVSLTVTALDASGFEVALIPHTLEVTVWGAREPRDRVNVEVDILAKYVERILEVSGS